MSIQPIGYIKLWRELATKPIWLNSTPEQKVILMTVLMKANFAPKQWEWKGEKFDLCPGQFITSLPSLAEDSGKGITIQNVRTALKRFEKLDFLTDESTDKGRLVTVGNWYLYQQTELDLTDEPTDDQQTPNRHLTPREEGNKVKKVKKVFIPPTVDEVKEYILSKSYSVDPKYFVEYYESRNWINAKGDTVKNWKSTIVTWNNREIKNNPKAKPYQEVKAKPKRVNKGPLILDPNLLMED